MPTNKKRYLVLLTPLEVEFLRRQLNNADNKRQAVGGMIRELLNLTELKHGGKRETKKGIGK